MLETDIQVVINVANCGAHKSGMVKTTCEIEFAKFEYAHALLRWWVAMVGFCGRLLV